MISDRKSASEDRTKVTLHSAQHAVKVSQARQDALSVTVCGNSGVRQEFL